MKLRIAGTAPPMLTRLSTISDHLVASNCGIEISVTRMALKMTVVNAATWNIGGSRRSRQRTSIARGPGTAAEHRFVGTHHLMSGEPEAGMMNKLSSPPHSTAGFVCGRRLRRSANESALIQSVTVPGLRPDGVDHRRRRRNRITTLLPLSDRMKSHLKVARRVL